MAFPFDTSDPMELLFRRMDSVMGGTKVRRPSTEPLSPEEEESLTRQLLGGAMGGLQWVGEASDKFGRATRGLLDGKPSELLNLIPFSDTMGITDPQQSVTGRQLLEDYGVLDANTEGLDAGDVAGFAAEILLDPTTYMTFGASALSKGGKALKNAGMLTKPMLRAGSRTTRTVGDILDATADIAARTKGTKALEDAARAAGTTVDALRGEKLGGLMGLGVPFMEPSSILGTGGIGQRLGGMMDVAGEAMRHGKIPGTNYSPGQHFASLFDSQAMGNTVPELDDSVRQLYDDIEKAGEGVRADIVRDSNVMRHAGMTGDRGSDALRAQMELGRPAGVDAATDSAVAQVSRRIKNEMKRVREMNLRNGREVPEFNDRAGVELAHRYAIDEIPNGSMHSRHDDLKHWQGGTETIKEIVRDSDIVNAATVEDAAEIIKRKYGNRFVEDPMNPAHSVPTPADYTAISEKSAVHALHSNRIPDGLDYVAPMVANRIRSMTKEQRAAGLFGNDVLSDSQRGIIAGIMQAQKDTHALRELAKNALDVRNVNPSEAMVPVRDVLAQLGLKSDETNVSGAVRQLMENMGLPSKMTEKADPAMAKYAMDRVVPERIADAITGLQKVMSGSDSAGKLVSAMDLATNVFKVGVLSWPSTKVRDFLSGQVANFLAGVWSPTSMIAAKRLINGKAPEALQEIPEVVKMLAERGLQNTPENAAEMLGELSYKHQLFSGQQGIGGTGHLGGAAAHTTASRVGELASEIPGVVPMNMKSVITAGDSWNPLNMRAITGAPTKSKWTAIFEEAGRYTDGINRLTGFIDQLRKGVDSGEAAKVVNAIQVNYKPESFTRFERTVLKRLIPFYSFHRKVIPEIVKTLMEKPGGRVAQTIRATNQPRSGDSFMPDYVSEGAAIPMGDGRYVTGFGLMHEALNDVVGIKPSVSGTVTRTAQKLGSMMNPLAKLPVEIMSGVNLYTGRPQKELYQYPTDDPLTNMILGNSPAARAIHTSRKLIDERKGLGVKALNLATGVGVTDLSGGVERAKQFAARRAAEELMKDSPNFKTFESYYVPEEMEHLLTEKERMAQRLRATNLKRAREIAKKKDKAKK